MHANEDLVIGNLIFKPMIIKGDAPSKKKILSVLSDVAWLIFRTRITDGYTFKLLDLPQFICITT